MPFVKLANLRDANVEFYSLQKGEHAQAELTELTNKKWEGPRIVDFTNELDDFADTAALMDNLDLIVTVDTSTAHLAGALGKPVWILNRFDSDWRYPPGSVRYSMVPDRKNFRQTRPNDWDDVIWRVRQHLMSKLI